MMRLIINSCCCCLYSEHGTGYRRSWNCCDWRTCFVVMWKHFCFILSTGTKIRIDSVMHPRSSSRGLNSSASVTVTVIVLSVKHGEPSGCYCQAYNVTTFLSRVWTPESCVICWRLSCSVSLMRALNSVMAAMLAARWSISSSIFLKSFFICAPTTTT